MTLTDIISKVTRYAKKVIVNDTTGTGDALSITGTTGTGASITTTTGTALKIQQNHTTAVQGGALEIFKSSGGDFVFDGGSDGIFSFNNTSTNSSRKTIFTGANFIVDNASVGIGTNNPLCSLQVQGGVRAAGGPPGPGGSSNAGYAFVSPGDVDSGMFSTGDGSVEFYSNNAEVMRVSNTGNVGINTSVPQRKLHVLGTVRLQGLPTYANNAAAIAGGLVADDVYKTTGGDLLIVV
jgi:hypothetical protein